MKIIDVGTGTGLLGVELHELGYTSLTALDISPEMLNETRKKNVYKKFICASLSDQLIPEIGTGEYDALICAGTLVKGHARSSAFVEMIRIVRIGKNFCLLSNINFTTYYATCLKTAPSARFELERARVIGSQLYVANFTCPLPRKTSFTACVKI